MNKVLLMGRLTADPEIRYTQSNIPVCTFVIAVDRRTKDDDADFPVCVAWRQTAEFMEKYLSKGRRIVVEGEVRTRNYTDKDGNNRKATEIQVSNIEFADSKKQEG